MKNEKVKYAELHVLIKIGSLVFQEEITVNKMRLYMVAKSSGRSPNEMHIHISFGKEKYGEHKKYETRLTIIIITMISTNRREVEPMRKIINGKMYDTHTAKRCASRDSNLSQSDFHYFSEHLYVKKTGEFFIYGCGGAMPSYAINRMYGEKITPITEEEAKKWMAEYGDVDKYIELFGQVEE